MEEGKIGAQNGLKRGLMGDQLDWRGGISEAEWIEKKTSSVRNGLEDWKD